MSKYIDIFLFYGRIKAILLISGNSWGELEMAKKAIEKESTEISTTKKSSVKKTTKKKGKTSKKNQKIIKIWNFIKGHKILVIGLSAIILIIIFILLFLKLQLGFTAVLVGNDEYSKADVNMTLYNLKYSYFGKDASDIPDATLDEQLTSVNMSVSDYLKSLAVNELKYRSAIKKMALDNNITLNEKDKKEVKESKQDVIDSFGSRRKFLKFLQKNGINESAYDAYLEANKLYDKVLDTLYINGKKYYTEEELNTIKERYYNTYYKVNQIVLALVDTKTMNNLSEIEINQKTALINTIKNEIDTGKDFLELVNKYSEEKSEDNTFYFTKNDVLESVYNAVVGLEVDGISGIIKTDYAYTIIKRLQLDDAKLDEFIKESLKEKFNQDIADTSEDYKAMYENSYKYIK